jgi:hypothetical protein
MASNTSSNAGSFLNDKRGQATMWSELERARREGAQAAELAQREPLLGICP